MREIVVISGKGGTGKTSLAGSFAVLGGKEVVVADCDVDAADMHLLLQPDFGGEESFISGELAVIDPTLCTGCGRCAEVCRFEAVHEEEGRYRVDEIGCQGCGYCARICPAGAIENMAQEVGHWFRSRIRTGSSMVHARLKIGGDNSGKLVAKVKSEARGVAEESGSEIILVDGSPGVGCPVVSSLSGASLAVLVTEPTVSGLHDLIRVHDLVKRFNIKAGCIINKCDLNPDLLGELRSLLDREGIVELAALPYDEVFTAAMSNGSTVVEWDPTLRERLTECWSSIKELAGL